MTLVGDGLSVDPDLVRAAATATAAALEPLGGATPDLVCVFVCEPGGDPAALTAAARRVAVDSGGRAVLGCSASGVIGGGRGVEGQSAVSVWAAVLPDTTVRAFHLEVLPAEGGAAVVGMPERRPDEQVGFVLADPWSFPADGFVTRTNDALPGLRLVGGLAAGVRGAGSTRLFLDGRAYDRGAVGVLLGGGIAARTVVSQGCRPVGPPMVVTRAAGNVVLELAGVRALDKVEQVVAALPEADRALAQRGLHVGVAIDEYAEEHERGDFLVRGLLGADPDRRGVVVGDLVEVGQTVRLQVRDADAADEDLVALLARARETGDRVAGALLVSCNGRGGALFAGGHGGPDHDVTVVRRELAAAGVAGFFAGGEIGPVGGRNHLHGFTASLLAFGAAAADTTASDVREVTRD